MKLLEGTVTVDSVEAFVERLGERHGVTVQAVDARYVADRRHLERAVELADRSIERGENVARDRAVEILLYAAGRRQIDRALEMGVDEGENRVVVLVDGGPSDAKRSSSEPRSGGDEADALEPLRELIDPEPTLGGDEAVLERYFDVTSAEREATDASLADLVRERVALLEVEK